MWETRNHPISITFLAVSNIISFLPDFWQRILSHHSLHLKNNHLLISHSVCHLELHHFSIKVYIKNFSLQILLWLPQLKTWFSNKNGKLYHNISTSSFPSRVWIINSFFGIFIFCMSNLVTLSMSKNFMDIVGKHKIIISHWLQGCLTWYSHTITTNST